MKDIELLPCPFCGAACHFEKDEGAWEWVECESCGMQGNRSASLMDDCKPILAEAWNRRAAIEADRAQRVPDIAEIRRILSCIKSSVDSGIPVTDGWRILEAMLASTPAPAQQERKPMTKEIEYQERISRLEVALKKSLEDRHPMTETQRRALIDRAGDLTDGLNQDDFADEIVKAVERHHGIKE